MWWSRASKYLLVSMWQCLRNEHPLTELPAVPVPVHHSILTKDCCRSLPQLYCSRNTPTGLMCNYIPSLEANWHISCRKQDSYTSDLCISHCSNRCRCLSFSPFHHCMLCIGCSIDMYQCLCNNCFPQDMVPIHLAAAVVDWAGSWSRNIETWCCYTQKSLLGESSSIYLFELPETRSSISMNLCFYQRWYWK